VLICRRLFAQIEISGTTDASLIVVDCAEGARPLRTTSAAMTANGTIERVSG
jgi:hypothetical protein